MTHSEDGALDHVSGKVNGRSLRVDVARTKPAETFQQDRKKWFWQLAYQTEMIQ